MRQGAFRWLSRQLAIAEGKAPDPRACLLGPGAALYPEAEIHNFSGSRDDIAVGANSHVRGRLLTYGHGGKIRVGEWCYIGVRTEIWSMQSVTIGDRVLIAHGVNIHDGTAHSLDAGERHRHFRHIVERGHPTQRSELPGISAAPVAIEDDVWISFGVTILRGVRIGRGSVIAAGAVVTQDVPPDTVYRCSVTPVLTPISREASSPDGPAGKN
jgi:maltose O-acetyltransferase